MKSVVYPSERVCRCWLVAGLLCWAGLAQGATFSVLPSSVSNTYAGQVALQIGGLTAGETVVIDKYLDANTNGVIDETDWLVRSFNLTDGQANMIGGVTNVNIPYDSDPTPGAIRTEAGFLTVGLSQTCVGRYLYRFSSPTGGFAAATNAFAVTNTVYGQGFTGKVQCNGTNIPYAGVLVMEDERGPIAETVADGSGTYSIQVAPGVYQLGAFKSGYVCDMGTQPAFTLGAGSPITTNLNLIPATQSISGRFVDATNSSIGLPGMLVVAQSTNNLLVLGFTGTNGDFAVPVTASGWEVGVDDEALSSYGYLSFQDRSPIDTTTGSVSGVAIAFPRGTALFYGTVKDDQNHPLAGLSLNAEDNGDYYSEGRGVTDTNGNYAIAVLAGAWHVKPSNNSPGYGNYLFSGVNTNIADGQAARVNFTGCIGVTVSGCVRGGGAPLEGLNVQVGTIIFHEGGGWNWQQTYQGNSTDSGGRYSIIVPPGTNYYVQVNPSQGSTWLGQFYSNAMDAVGATVVVALTNAPATNIDFNLQQGASVSGRVKGGGSPLAGIEVKAGMVTFRSGGGSDFQDQGSRGHSDSNGYYTLVLPPGTDYTVVANPDNSGSPWLTQYYSNTMDIAQAKLVTALTNAPATNINFNLNQGAIVSGYVLGNGAPLSGLWVGVGTITTNQGGGWNWKQSYYSNSSDSNGNYSVTVPPGSNYYAQVSLPHGSPWLQQFYSNAMDYSSATVISVLTNAPATNINFNLNQGAIVSGYVLGNGAPLNGVNVQVGTITTNQGGGWNWNQSYDANNGTDSNGYYSVTLPPGTNYYASVCSSPWLRQFYSNATDYSSATVISALTNAPATNINFYLILGMTIEGYIIDATNNPVSTSIEFGRLDGTNWLSLWWWGSGSHGDYSCTIGATSNLLMRITDGRFHEVYFSNKLSAVSADTLSGDPGVILSNVNFKLYDPSADSDHDGLRDYIEGYVTGTDPFNSNDCLRCTGIQSSNKLVTLTWASVSGKFYGIERSTNLLSGSAWTNLVPLPVMAVGSKASLMDSNMPPCSVYRVFINY